MNSTPLPKDILSVQSSPSSLKTHHARIVGLLAMGLLTVSGLFTILAKPQAFASLFNANRDLAMNSDLLMVGAKLKEPISSPISSPISGPLTRVPKPKVTEFLAYPTITPKITLTPGPLTGTVVPLLTPTPTQTLIQNTFRFDLSDTNLSLPCTTGKTCTKTYKIQVVNQSQLTFTGVTIKLDGLAWSSYTPVGVVDTINKQMTVKKTFGPGSVVYDGQLTLTRTNVTDSREYNSFTTYAMDCSNGGPIDGCTPITGTANSPVSKFMVVVERQP